MPRRCDKFYKCLRECCKPIEQRYTIAALVALGILVNNMQRISFYIALVKLTNRIRTDPTQFKPDEESWDLCPHIFLSSEGKEGEKDWSDAMQGCILASFYFGCILSCILGGYLSDRHGGKHILGVLLSSITSLLTPLAIWLSPYFVMFVRAVMGFAQGPMFPAAASILARWSLRQERALIAAITYSAIPLSSFLGNLLSGIIVEIMPLNWIFFIFGSLGFLWYLFWLMLVFSSPQTHRFITEDERDYISKFYDSPAPVGSLPYREMLKSFKFHVVAWANFGFDWGFYIISMELPFYLRNVLYLPILKIGVVSSLPWLSMWIGAIIFGILSHFLIFERIVRRIEMRKIMAILATMIPGVLLILSSWASCSHVLVCLLVSTSMFYAGAAYSGMRMSIVDLSPNFAGFSTSVINLLGAVAGFLIPIIVHSIIHDGGTVMEWRISFWIATTFMIVTPLPYIFFVTTMIQPWNSGHQEEAPRPEEPMPPPQSPPPRPLTEEEIVAKRRKTRILRVTKDSVITMDGQEFFESLPYFSVPEERQTIG